MSGSDQEDTFAPAKRLLRRVTSVITVVALALVGWFAVRSAGTPVHDAALGSGAVWVSSDEHGWARVDTASYRMNKVVPLGDVTQVVGTVDVAQDGSAAIAWAGSRAPAIILDARTGNAVPTDVVVPAPADKTGEPLSFKPAPLVLRAGSIALVDPRTGDLRITRYDERVGPQKDDLAPLLARSAPVQRIGGTAAVTVGTDGVVHAVSGDTGKVVSYAPSGDRFVPAGEVTLPITARAVDITALGPRWVVLDASGARLFAQGNPEPFDAGIDKADRSVLLAALQEPGPAAPRVGILGRGEARLSEVAEPDDDEDNGGVVLPVENSGSGLAKSTLTRPVVQGRCLRAAWLLGKVYYGVNCGDQAQIPAVTLDPKGNTGGSRPSGVRFRLNRSRIVLDLVTTGEVWSIEGDPVAITDWTRAAERQRAVAPPATRTSSPTRTGRTAS
ncbi:hypothetical protein [Janibacter massiliensis]|uniref:hypothetical protein n=1 Tax=Janibacter massiliensis TaxID=2058291 RepID=UPI000D0ED83B|nr:hypothetical protein [Janibacter massiliensis]